MLIGVSFALTGASHRAAAAGSCSGGDAALDGEEQSLIALVNGYRAQHGLVRLTTNAVLNRTAAWMVEDLSSHGIFSHTDSLGRPFYVRAKDCGYAMPGGENLSGGTIKDTGALAFDQFRNSPAHDAIMLSPEFREIGVARTHGGPLGWYWAVEFGLGAAEPEDTPTPTPAPPPPPPPAGAAPVRVAQPAAPAVVVAPAAPAAEAAVAPALAPMDWDGSAALPANATLIRWSGGETPAAGAMSGLGGESYVVYTYDVWFKVWLHYSPGMPGMLQTLDTLRPGNEYWVLATP